MNSLTQAGLTLIETWEGLNLTAYQDVAGIWTIGWGHTPSYKGQVITTEMAQLYLMEDLTGAEIAVGRCTAGSLTNDNQFSAMVSLAFNIGNLAFKSSSVLRFHRNGDYGMASTAFLLWDKAHENGKLVTVQGLLNRRRAEAKLYASPVGACP